MKTKEKCIVPDCKESPRTRGYCVSHYSYVSRLVRGGCYTWDDLVKRGKALGTKRGSLSKWLRS